jgi:hypothetical protein
MPASPSVYSDREDEHGVAPRPGERYLGLVDRRDGVGLQCRLLAAEGWVDDKGGGSRGSAEEAANRSRAQQLCAAHRSPRGLSDRLL